MGMERGILFHAFFYFRKEHTVMDSMDRSILKCLSENSRRSATVSVRQSICQWQLLRKNPEDGERGIIQQYT